MHTEQTQGVSSRVPAPEQPVGRRKMSALLVSRSQLGRSLLPVVFCLACVVEVSAQTSRAHGWVIGLETGRAAVSFEDDPGDGAALVGARLGHALNRIVTPYVGLAYADIESRGREAFDNVTLPTSTSV